MKKSTFRILVVILVIVLAVVSFYMLFVHVPYYNYYHELYQIRDQICIDNNYEYSDYFSEYRGKNTYYMLKVSINGTETYVAYDTDLNLVDSYQGSVADEDSVKAAILEKYEVNIDELQIAYENQRFVYYGLYQDDSFLLYVYYDLSSGDFIKAVKLDE